MRTPTHPPHPQHECSTLQGSWHQLHPQRRHPCVSLHVLWFMTPPPTGMLRLVLTKGGREELRLALHCFKDQLAIATAPGCVVVLLLLLT